jgi:hypothetical protein
VGATVGGTLVYEFGFNVETAGDHPAWHRSEIDVLPGDQASRSPTGTEASVASPGGASGHAQAGS